MGDLTVPAPSLALKAAIGLGLVADLAMVALLLLVSGFVFGGPQGAQGSFGVIAGWGAALAVCVLSPLAAVPLWRRGRRDTALAMVWMPVAALLVGVAIGSF